MQKRYYLQRQRHTLFSIVLVGIVSRGKGCGLKNRPGIYARVNALLDWIKEEASDGSGCSKCRLSRKGCKKCRNAGTPAPLKELAGNDPTDEELSAEEILKNGTTYDPVRQCTLLQGLQGWDKIYFQKQLF